MVTAKQDSTFRVLLVERSGAARPFVKPLLARAGIADAAVHWSTSVGDAAGHLADATAGIVIIGVDIADPDGIAAIVRLQAAAPGIPILPFLSPAKADSVQGASAVLGSPQALACLQQVLRQREVQRRLVHFATHDRLTGLANRWLLEDRLKRAIARSHREALPGALLFIDLDNFKAINDRHGHDAGDAVLAMLAQRLQRSLRETDTVARYGGDEFVVVLERLPEHAVANRIAAKTVKLIGAPYNWNDRELRVGASIGVTHFSTARADAGLLLREADRLMYAVKRARLKPAATPQRPVTTH